MRTIVYSENTDTSNLVICSGQVRFLRPERNALITLMLNSMQAYPFAGSHNDP